MASEFESDAVAEFVRSFLTPFGQTVTRRIGGQDDRTEPVIANVDFDDGFAASVDTGGLTNNDRGEYTDVTGRLDIRADQATAPNDSWVIDGEVYNQVGVKTGSDGGSKTVLINRRVSSRARGVRVRR